uniref:Mucin-17 n=1 Tax=Chinchilla lanigera TaxID=34839 RepID=A0A8C2VM39_CHILA
LNGGSWTGEACYCPPQFTGDRCQYAVEVCNNGGSWDGLKCLCPELFYGPRCDDVVDGVEMVSALKKLTVTVTSQEYNSKLQDPSSEEFKNFNSTFAEQMKIIYDGIPEYEGVNITQLRPGSVVVEHDVILKTNYTPEYKQVLEKASEQVEKKILNATAEQISNSNNTCVDFLLCFNSTATLVQNATVFQYDPEEECRKEAGTYAAYFTVEYKDQKPYCITPCMPGFNASLDCHYGKCQMQRSGPHCNCLITATHWYQGETCEWGIQKSLVYGLTGAGAAVVLVVMAVLLVFALRARRMAKRQKYRVSQLYKWYEEGGGPTPGTFHNTGFDLSEEHLSGPKPLKPPKPRSPTGPALYWSSLSFQIHIQRPQVIMTAM